MLPGQWHLDQFANGAGRSASAARKSARATRKWIYNADMMYFGRLCLMLAVFICILPGVVPQNTQVKKVSPRTTNTIIGKEVFRDYCAACHGLDGKGAGPAAASLKQHPTDLTQMSKQHGGTFPEEQFMSILNGTSSTPSHGSADMPVWGSVFRNMKIGRAHV